MLTMEIAMASKCLVLDSTI